MKKVNLIIVFLLIINITSFSQSNRVYTTPEITWLGLDYSHADFIDQVEFSDPYKLKHQLIDQWNNMVFKEKNKYNISKSFNKQNVRFNTNYINSRNKEAEIINQIISYPDYENQFNNDSIQKIIKTYELDENNEGIGLVFIVENLDRTNTEAIYWVTFFDLNTKEVMLTEKIYAKPSGVGIRNYWANSFCNALENAGYEMGFLFK